VTSNDNLERWAAPVVAGFTFIGTYLASNIPSITREALSLVSCLISGTLAEVVRRTFEETQERKKRIHQHIDPHLTRILSILNEIPSNIAQLLDFRKALPGNRRMDERAQEAYNELICDRLRRVDTLLQILEDEGGFAGIELLEKSAVSQIQNFRQKSVDYMALSNLLEARDSDLQTFRSHVERTINLLVKLKLN
jgi:hypothetical protein